MRKGTTFAVFLVGLLLGGCTPFNENVARKAVLEPAVSEQGVQGSVAEERVSRPEADLEPATREIIRSYGPTVKRYADRYGFDWRLILAVMKQESGFSPTAESEKGASGLMQIMPVTGSEVARVLELADLNHPRNNIRGGVFYLKRLYDLFEGAEESDRIKLALAAYNAGIGRIYDAQEVAAYLHDNPTRWQSVKDALPLLSKRYYTLHRNVWQQDKPRTGWFGDARQTVTYVESVMDYYDEYRLVLN